MSDAEDQTGERPETPGVEYEVLDFAPPEAIVGRIFALYDEVFGESTQEQLVDLIRRKTTVLAILAREDVQIIGFKVGFEEEPGIFHSWLGAVAQHWRGKGVGANLLEMQHTWCEENGYETVRTTGANHYKQMLMLNLRHGFDVVGTRVRAGGEVEVLLEKLLHPDGPPEAESGDDADTSDD